MRIRYVLWIVTILWAAMIFCFSAQPASDSAALSGTVTRQFLSALPFVKMLSLQEQQELIAMMHHVIRKIAHFSLYAVLGLLVFSLCKSYGLFFKKAFLYALCICFLYAITDEIHQLFVAGRGGRFFDVFLDTVGAFCGIVLCQFCIFLRCRRRV